MKPIIFMLAVSLVATPTVSEEYCHAQSSWGDLIESGEDFMRNPRKAMTDWAAHHERMLKKAGDDLLDSLAKLERDIKKGTFKGASEELWGEAGRYAYFSAAKAMNLRSPRGNPMPKRFREALRPHFGDLVDRVVIHWSVTPLDAWIASNFEGWNKLGISEIKIQMGENTNGQTFGYDIYMRWGENSRSFDQTLHLLAHELAHTKQFENFGKSLSNFGYHYFKEYKKANQNYKNNKLEVDAENEAEKAVAGSANARLGRMFGYSKNAILTGVKGQPAEAMSGHINWARNQQNAIVSRETRSHVNQIMSKKGTVSREMLINCHVWMKEAWSTASGNVEHGTKGTRGWIAKNNPSDDALRNEIKKFSDRIRQEVEKLTLQYHSR